MTNKDNSQEAPRDPADQDDVEILEVVGMEEDIPAAAPEPSEIEGGDSREIVLTLDAEQEPEAEPEDAESEEESDEPSSIDPKLVQRLRADYDNLRKRVARERLEFQLQANSALIEGLLPVLDNFDRALSVKIGSGADGAFRAGMVMIYTQLTEALKKEGLRAIDSVGQAFDPNLHDAVATDAESTEPPNTVVEEMQRGYLFQDRVLRHAMVTVSTNGSLPGAPDEDEDDG